VVYQVVQKFVLQLEAQLADRGVTFDLSEEAVKWLAEKGYDSRMGARPLSRVIQEHIKQPLADEVLFGKLKKGGTVKVTVKTGEDGKDGLNLEAIEDGPVTPKPEPLPKEKRPPRKRAPRPLFATARKPPGPPTGNGKRGGLVPKVPLKTN
jgi:ATP-dependent Clp protease ATP-binding subunit ClpA